MKEFEEWLNRQHYLGVMEALKLHDEGWTISEIVAYFNNQYGMVISGSTISRWIKEAKRRGYGNKNED